MEQKEKKTHKYGLVGKDIDYSFSKGYFTEKFSKLNLVHHSYENFEFENINEFPETIAEEKALKGLNVTIPYKELVIPYLSSLNEVAQRIGAVNTIKFTDKGLVGYNTDAYGFEKSIQPHLQNHHLKALILGTGGASKAIAYIFESLNIEYKFVSRNPEKEQIGYHNLTQELLTEYTVLVNCTPLGTSPQIQLKPNIPYQFLSDKHLLFDLIYNPSKTAFLQEGEAQGALICNGERMLEFQAEKAWEIWNS